MNSMRAIVERRWLHTIVCLAALSLFVAAAPVHAQQTSLFTYYGSVQMSNGSAVPAGIVARVRNITRADTVTAVVGERESGKYQVVVVDFLANNAASTGDSIEIALTDSGGAQIGEAVVVVLSPAHISSARLRTDFMVGNPGVVVTAPVSTPVAPGTSAVFEFIVHNTGDIEDSYSIGVTVKSGHIDWVTPVDTAVGPVAPGGFAVVPVTYSVPVGVDWTIYEFITLEACSMLEPGVCAQAETLGEVPVAVVSSLVRYFADHVEVTWTLSADAVGLPHQLFRRRLPETSFVSLGGGEDDISGETGTFEDRDVEPGRTYEYFLEITGGETFVFPLGRATVPRGTLLLEQNYPNPFNPATRIRFELDEPAHATLSVFDVSGRPVRTLVDRQLSANRHTVTWDGTDDEGRFVASGVYFYRLVAGKRVLIRRMVLLK